MKTSCWFCDRDIRPAFIEAEGCLVPRHTKEGGPLRVFACPHCGTENGAERNAAGESLLVPCVRLGLQGTIDSLFDRQESVLQAHARAWFQKNADQRSAFHATPPRPWSDLDPGVTGEPESEPGPEVESDDEPDTPEEDAPEPGPGAGNVAILLDHYATLEIALGATAAEVHAAYRRLGKKCHPDKVAHLDKDFQALADRKFRRLKAAYEAILAALE